MTSDLSRRFLASNEIERTEAWNAWQASQTKYLVQSCAEASARNYRATAERLIFWVAAMAIISLAGERLWIAAALVPLILGIERLWSWRLEIATRRLDRFRHRFGEILDQISSPFVQMLEEDKKFLRKWEDSVLHPLAVAPNRREKPSVADLKHIQTLYCQYVDSGLACRHWPETTEPDCESCASYRIRKHIEAALTKFDSAVEAARKTLVAAIDSNNSEPVVNATEFLDAFNRIFLFHSPLDTEQTTLVEWLRDKSQWTFEDADKVRTICARDRDDWEDLEGSGRFTKQVYDGLSLQIAEAMVRHGLLEQWKWYDAARDWLVDHEGAMKDVRRLIGRQPEAMLREFEDQMRDATRNTTVRQVLVSLPNYGYDAQLVEKEMTVIRNYATKGAFYEDYRTELNAALAFIAAENAVDEQRWKHSGRWKSVLRRY